MDDEECPGEDECDDLDCDERQIFHVYVERTVKFKINAHSEDEATAVAQDVLISVDQLHNDAIEDWDDGEDDIFVQSEREAFQQAAESRRLVEEALAEEDSGAPV